MRAFFAAGGEYDEEAGYYVDEDAYLPAFDEWLPRKWQFRGDPPGPVLLPDMLPSNVWQSNLRTLLPAERWDRIRKFCYMAAGHTCIACGSRGEPHLEAHEAWRFDERTHRQVLVGLYCLCPTCHKAKHLGYARRIGRYDAVVARLLWLNDWDEDALAQAIDQVAARQERLSGVDWTLDLEFLRAYGVR
jgi:hypothetical protein